MSEQSLTKPVSEVLDLGRITKMDTKSDVNNLAMAFVDDVFANVDEIDFYANLRKLEHFIKRVKSLSSDRIVDVLEMHGGRSTDGLMKISLTNMTRYNYKTCNDPVYEGIISKMEELKDMKSGREAYLRSLKSPVEVIDPETGESFNVVPPTAHVSTVPKLTWE